MTIDEIISYIMDTPENTNPNILKEMLNEMASGGGSSRVFAVHCDNWNSNNTPAGTIDVPYADLVAAMGAEKFCIICFYDLSQEYQATITLYQSEYGPVFTYQGTDYQITNSGEINEYQREL